MSRPSFNEITRMASDRLSAANLPTRLQWLFREDVIQTSSAPYVRFPANDAQESAAEGLYVAAGNRGVAVVIVAMCTVDESTGVFVWPLCDELAKLKASLLGLAEPSAFHVGKQVPAAEPVKSVVHWQFLRVTRMFRRAGPSQFHDLPWKGRSRDTR